MITTKSLGIGAGLITSAAGLTGLVGYSTGLFNSKELSNPNTQISELLDEENKYSLLPISGSDNASEGSTAGDKYKTANTDKALGEDKGGLAGGKVGGLDQMPSNFKSICDQKSKEKIKDKKDPKYQDVIDYCSRPKTLQEVLKKEGLESFLDTNNKDSEWKTRYSRYKSSNNKFPSGVGETGSGHAELKNACKAAMALKTTDSNYQTSYNLFKAGCLTS